MVDNTDNKAKAKWYVVKVHSAFDKAVKDKILQRVQSLNLQDYIFEVFIPIEKQVRIRNGKRTEKEERIYPGYILIHMIMNDQVVYALNNIEHVSGFLGSRTSAESISQEEVDEIKKRMENSATQKEIEFQLGDTVRVVDGPFEEFEGKISEIDANKGQVLVLIPMFGRDTPVKLDLFQIRGV